MSRGGEREGFESGFELLAGSGGGGDDGGWFGGVLGHSLLFGFGLDAGEEGEGAVVWPAGALDGLQEGHHHAAALQVAELGQDVDRGLDDTDGLVEDGVLVSDVIRDGEVDAREVGLQQEEGFDVRIPHGQTEVVTFQREGGRELGVDEVFVVADWQLIVFRSSAHPAEDFLERGRRSGVLEQCADGLVRQIVVTHDLTHGCWFDFAVGIERQTAGVGKLGHGVIDHINHVVVGSLLSRHAVVLLCRNLKTVVRRILVQTAEEKRPCQVVQSVLSCRDRLRGYFSTQVIVEHVVQRRLNWETGVKEVLVERLLAVLCEDACDSGSVELRSTGSTQHLQYIGEVHVLVAFNFGVEVLRAFDNDKMGRQVDTPGQRACGHKNLNLVVCEELFGQLSVRLDKTGMVKPDAEAQ